MPCLNVIPLSTRWSVNRKSWKAVRFDAALVCAAAALWSHVLSCTSVGTKRTGVLLPGTWSSGAAAAAPMAASAAIATRAPAVRRVINSLLGSGLDGRVVGLQVTDRVLHAGENVLEKWRDGVIALVVAVRLVEEAACALAADPAQGVVVITPRIRLLRLVLGAHLVVVDAGEHADVVAGEGLLVERVGLVADLPILPLEHRRQRALRVVDLDRDQLRVIPVELEVAADDLVPLGPERAAAWALGCGVGVLTAPTRRGRRQKAREAWTEVRLRYAAGFAGIELVVPALNRRGEFGTRQFIVGVLVALDEQGRDIGPGRAAATASGALRASRSGGQGSRLRPSRSGGQSGGSAAVTR